MRKILLSLILSFFAILVYGQYRSVNEAKGLAEQFLNSRKGARISVEGELSVVNLPMDSLYKDKVPSAVTMKQDDVIVSKLSPSKSGNTPSLKSLPNSSALYATVPTKGDAPFYIFNDSLNKSSVIIAADERMTTVLGYTDNGIFDYSSAPDALKLLMEQYAEAYNFLQVTDEELEPRSGNVEVQPVAPLLSTVWGQNLPFNRQAPYIGIHRGVTGCVATAMSQIMNFHKYPEVGIGTHSYVSRTEELELYHNFSATTFDWSSMRDSYTESYTNKEANAVATLMRSCGIAVNMDYCYTSEGASSGAYSFDVPYALRTHFGYNDNMAYYAKDYFNDEEWNQIIYDELKAGRPIYYSGNGDLGGHAFVLDGCDSEGLFHINWGWEGYYDGYFSLSALEPYYSCSFSNGQAMVCHITPETVGEEESTFYATSFVPYMNEVDVDSMAYFALVECYNYSNRTSYTRQDVTENWTISIDLYDEQLKFVKSLDSFDTELSTCWGYRYAWLGFVPSELGLTEGKTYHVVPTVCRVGGETPTPIRTEKGETDSYEIHISNGKLIVGEKPVSTFDVDGIRYSVLEDTRSCVEIKGISLTVDYLVIPERVTFENMTYTVTAIGDEVFKDLGNLYAIELPSTIKRIGCDAFKGCWNLMTVVCYAQTPPTCARWTNYPFDDVSKAELLVPENTRGLYRCADGWDKFISVTEGGEDFPEFEEVTYQYVNSPDFDSSFYGWETTTGAINNQLNNNQTDWVYATGLFWENWNSSAFSGKMYQTLSVPNGIYRLEMVAFADMASGVYVYANTATTEVLSDVFDRIYSVEVLVTDGVLEIGLLMPEAIHTWVGMDNVRLYYSEQLGEKMMSEILAGQIKASFDVTFRNSMEHSLLEELNAAIENARKALYKDVEAEMQEAYDSLIEVTQRAQESSEVYQRVREALDKLKQEAEISKASSDVIEEANALYEKVWASYVGGVWTKNEEIDVVVEELELMTVKVKIPNVANASDDNPIDMTTVIANHDLSEYNMDWTGTGGWLWHTNYHNVEFWNENFSYYQELKGLPNGIYRISVQGFYRPGTPEVAGSYYTQDDRSKLHAVLFADTGDTITQTYIQSIMNGASKTRVSNTDVIVSGSYIPNDMGSAWAYFERGEYTENYLFVEVKNNNLVIGLFKDVWLSEDWMIFNKWNLYYYGENSVHYHGECSGTYKLTCTGGSQSVSMELCPGDTIELPQDYAKYGHTLVGWEEVPTIMPARNLTVKAQFMPTVYAVVYCDADGTELFRDSVAYNEILLLRDYPVQEGYTFKAWIYDRGEIPQRMPAADIVLVADVITDVEKISERDRTVDVYSLDGILLKSGIQSRELFQILDEGFYIIDKRKVYLKK